MQDLPWGETFAIELSASRTLEGVRRYLFCPIVLPVSRFDLGQTLLLALFRRARVFGNPLVQLFIDLIFLTVEVLLVLECEKIFDPPQSSIN